jgi:hypothetical protein
VCLHYKTLLVTIYAVAIALLFSNCSVYIFGLNQTTAYGSLILTFEADRSQVRVGEPVHMRFTIKNVGSKPWVIESQDTPVMDIRVDVVGDGTLLTWSVQNPAQVSHRLEWKPGESKVIEWSWTPKQGDVYSGAEHDIGLIGVLFGGQAAGVRVCASDVCR